MKKIFVLVVLFLFSNCSQKNQTQDKFKIVDSFDEEQSISTVFNYRTSSFIDSLKRLLFFIENTKKSHFFIQRKWTQLPFNVLPEISAVIETPTKRYSLYYDKEKNTISLWFRPKGTTSKKLLSHIFDEKLDGEIDIAGKAKPMKNRVFLSKNITNTEEQGGDHKKYWRQKYKNAVKDILEYFISKEQKSTTIVVLFLFHYHFFWFLCFFFSTVVTFCHMCVSLCL